MSQFINAMAIYFVMLGISNNQKYGLWPRNSVINNNWCFEKIFSRM